MRCVMDHLEVERCFTRTDGAYLFARWGRPIVPAIFGVDDATLSVVKGAIEAIVTLADHSMAETDPELGGNLLFFFFQDWSELTETPNLDRLVPDLAPLVERLQVEGAHKYRLFRFDEAGTIKAVFVFLRMGGELGQVPAADLALAEAAQMMLLWSEQTFAEVSPLGKAGEQVVLRPDIGDVIRAAYDPVMPAVARDASHALRLAARLAGDEAD